jgi:dephospho-CoA kinase
MAKIKIVGISGTNGSGKDSLGQMLAERHGWLFVSVTDILRDELKKRGEPIERENLRKLSSEWHKKYGAGALTDMAAKKFEQIKDQYHGLVFASIRRPGEAIRLHELGGKLVWIDADPKVRFGRIAGRNRGAEDNKTFDEFIADELIEMQGSSGHSLNMNRVKELADIFLENSGSDIEKFKDAAEKALEQYLWQ